MKNKQKFLSVKARTLVNACALTLTLFTLATTASPQQSGLLIGWGYNEFGQCPPPPNPGFVAAAGGNAHTLGLRTDGSIAAWGYPDGRCIVPPPNAGFAAVAAGQSHSMGLKTDGWIAVWNGLLNVPPPNAGFAAISTINLHSLALRSDSSIAAWGFNNEGACNVPPPNTGFVAIAAGGYHSLGLKANGSVVGWGRNNAGQCDPPEPNSGFVAIAAGDIHSVGLRANGSIEVWGAHEQVPEPNSGFVAIAAGHSHSLGLRNNGSIEPWGVNEAGQLNVPEPNEGYFAIACGWYHSLGIRNDIQTIFATTTTLGPGVVGGGSPFDIHFGNNSYYTLKPGVVLTSSQSPIVLKINFNVPDGSPTLLRSVIQSRAQFANTRQTIEVYNFSTNTYNVLNQQVLPTIFPDTVITSTLNPANHIGPGNEVRLKISYKAIGPMFGYPWRVFIDEATLRLTP